MEALSDMVGSGRICYCCLSGRVVEERVDWKSGGNRQGVRDEVKG